MNRTIAYCTLICTASVLIAISVTCPQWLSDKNSFLVNFVNQQVLNLLGVILAITLASVANLHLALNRIEEKYKRKNAFMKTRSSIKKGTNWLIGLFVACFISVFIKPIVANSDVSQAIFNSISIFILLWHILILITLTQLIFSIEADVD